jgi:hypothetical protein
MEALMLTVLQNMDQSGSELKQFSKVSILAGMSSTHGRSMILALLRQLVCLTIGESMVVPSVNMIHLLPLFLR